MDKPKHDAPPSPVQRRELSPSIRTYAGIDGINELHHVSKMYDAMTGRKPLAKPENAAMFAILFELRRIERHPEPDFGDLKRLIGDLEYLKCSAKAYR